MITPRETETVRHSVDPLELRRLASGLLAGHADAEDVAQDAWFALRRIHPGRVHDLWAWIRAAMLHRAVRMREEERRRRERERSVARAERMPAALDLVEQRSVREHLARLVERLEEPYREVIRLRYLEGLEIDEVAFVTGRTRGTVRSQVKRGLDRLRMRMGVETRWKRGFAGLLFGPWWRGSGSVARAPAERLFAAGLAASVASIGIVAVTRPERSVPRALSARSTAAAPERLADASEPERASAHRQPVVIPAAVPAERAAGDPAVTVTGIVTDPEGEPVAGARVFVGPESGDGARAEARADARGRYRIEDVDPRLFLWAATEVHAPSSRHLLGSSRPDEELELCLGYPLGALEGRVLSAEGSPVGGAAVTLHYPGDRLESDAQGTLVLHPLPSRTWSAPDGTFRLGLPRAKNFQLLVESAEHAPLLLPCIRSGAALALECRLPPPAVLEGRVVRPDGSPAGGACIELAFPGRLPARETCADAGGTFRFDALPPGRYTLRLLADPGSSASCFLDGFLAPGEQAWRIVELAEGSTLRGRACEGDRPLARWTVELHDLSPEGPAALRRVLTDSEGAFAFPSCSREKEYGVHLLEPAAAGGTLRAVAGPVRPGDEAVLLRADGAAPTGRLAGTIVGESSRSLRGIATLLGGCADARWILVAPSGAFDAPDVPVGRYTLRAWVPGLGAWEESVGVQAGETTELQLGVPRPGTLRVRLEGDAPLSLDGWFAAVAQPALDDPLGTSVAALRAQPESASFEIDLLPGEHAYWLRYRGVLYETRRVRIEAGAVAEQVHLVRDLVCMSLRLEAEQPPAPGERLELLVRAPGAQRTVERGSNGPLAGALTLPVVLSRATEELRLRTRSGLVGTLALAEGDVVPGGELRMELARAGE